MLVIFAILSALSALTAALGNLVNPIKLLWVVPVTFIGSYLSLILLFSIILAIIVWFTDVNKPIKRSSKAFRYLIHQFLLLAVPLLGVRIHATGLNKVPRDSRFLLVSNHLHDFDPAIFMYCLPNAELAFVGKKEIYKDMVFVSKAMHRLNGLPIDRENNRNAVLTIGKAAEQIKENTVSMAIFPEGYCSKTGELLEFRNGAFKIAKKAHCPIVVATLKNTKQIVPNIFKRKTDVYVDILDVIPTEKVDELSTAELGEIIHKQMSDNLK